MNSATIYGINAVNAALKSDQTITKILLVARGSRRRFQSILQMAAQKGIPVQFVPTPALNRKAATEKHQGVVAFLGAFPLMPFEKLLEKTKESAQFSFLAMLDGIEDPHNFGAIIRSAEAAGVAGIIIQERRSAPISPVVNKTSAGAVNFLPIARVKNLAQTMDHLKQEGFWLVGTDDKAGENFWNLVTDRPLLVIVGNEGKGIRPLLKKKCDFLVRIPMYGKIESLNASVAAALMFYEIRRKNMALA